MFILFYFFVEREKEDMELDRWGESEKRQLRGTMIRIYCLKNIIFSDKIYNMYSLKKFLILDSIQ